MELLFILLPLTGFAQENLGSLRSGLSTGKMWRLATTKTSDGELIPIVSELFLRFDSDSSGIREEKFKADTNRTHPPNNTLKFSYTTAVNGKGFVINFKNLTYIQGKKEYMATEPKLNSAVGYRVRLFRKDNKQFLRLTLSSTGGGKPNIHYYFN